MVKIHNRMAAAAMLLISLSAGVLANHRRNLIAHSIGKEFQRRRGSPEFQS